MGCVCSGGGVWDGGRGGVAVKASLKRMPALAGVAAVMRVRVPVASETRTSGAFAC